MLVITVKGIIRNGRGVIALSLDLVLAPEHVIDLSQVVSALSEGGNFTLGAEVLLKVSVVAELAELRRC